MLSWATRIVEDALGDIAVGCAGSLELNRESPPLKSAGEDNEECEMKAGVLQHTHTQSQSPIMTDRDGRQESMMPGCSAPVVTSVTNIGTTPETGKNKNRTSKNFTCTAKENLELEDAAYQEQPALNVSSQDRPLDSGVKESQGATGGDHPGQPLLKTSQLNMTPSR